MICAAARSCAASYAAATSGCSSAASDQDFGPFTTTSTNRTACASARSRPRGSPVSGSSPATHASYPSPVSDASSTTRPSGPVGEPLGDPGAFGEVVVVRAGPVGLHVVAGSGRRTAVHLHPTVHLPNHFQ